MAKLHELLAVEGDLEGTFKKILQERYYKKGSRGRKGTKNSLFKIISLGLDPYLTAVYFFAL